MYDIITIERRYASGGNEIGKSWRRRWGIRSTTEIFSWKPQKTSTFLIIRSEAWRKAAPAAF